MDKYELLTTQEDFLKKVTVKIETKIANEKDPIGGSGVAYLRESYTYSYIITALHCLLGIGFKSSQDEIEKITVQYRFSDDDDPKRLDIQLNNLVLSQKENDFAILLVETEELINPISELPKVELLTNRPEEAKEFDNRGYIKVFGYKSHWLHFTYQETGKTHIECKLKSILKDTSGNNAVDIIAGLSGSGVFVKDTNKMVAIVSELKSPDGFDNVILCKKIPDIGKLFENQKKEIINLNKQTRDINAARKDKPDMEHDETEWLKMKKEDTTLAYKNYLTKFPTGKFAQEANSLIDELTCWHNALEKGAFAQYGDTYKTGRFSQSDFDHRFMYLALKNISNFGDTDIFPFPFETDVFKEKAKETIAALIKIDEKFQERIDNRKDDKRKGDDIELKDEFYPKNISTLAPSGYTGFRWVTQIEPIWNAYYLQLVLSIAQKIENERLPIDRNIIFSYRFSPNYETGALFGKRDAFKITNRALCYLKKLELPVSILDKLSDMQKEFTIFTSEDQFLVDIQKKIGESDPLKYRSELLKYTRINFSDWHAFQYYSYKFTNDNDKYQYVLTCDIADFYNRLNHKNLDSALGIIGIEEQVRDKINFLLRIFSLNKSHGLPIGGNASRLLAELALRNIDNFLDIKNIKFCRFVDDFHIFAENENEARSILCKLAAKLLESEGLALQKQKTQILTRSEFTKLIKVRLFADSDDGMPSKQSEFVSFSRDYPTEVKQDIPDDSDCDTFDINDLINEELRKSRINEPFTKRLLVALRNQTDNEKVSKAFIDIFKKGKEKKNKLLKLAPIFSTVMIAAFQNFDKLVTVEKIDAKKLLLSGLLELIRDKSYILDVELNLAFLLRVLGKAERNSQIYKKKYQEEQVDLAKELNMECYQEKKDSKLIKSILLQNFIKWDYTQLFSTLFDEIKDKRLDHWEKRLIIIGFSLFLGEVGKSWIKSEIKSDTSNPFEKTLFQWCSGKDKQELKRIL